LNSVSAAGGAQRPAGPVGVAADGMAIFADATERLGALRSRLTEMGEDLTAFATLSNSGEASAAATRALAAHAASAAAVLGGSLDPERAQAARVELGRARQYLFAIARLSQTLAAVATLTRATAGSYGVQSLAGYLGDLGVIARSIRENVDVVGAQLKLVDAGRSTMEECAATALGRLSRMGETIDRAEAQTIETVERERTVGGLIAAEAETLRGRGKSQLKAFVGTVQFSDRLAQRLDHLGSILAYDDGHARRLAAAQIASICAAIRETADHAAAAAGEIGAIGRAGGELFLAGEIAESIRDSVRRRAGAADAIGREMAGVEAALGRTRESVADAATAMTEARACFATLESCARRVASASINSTLLSARAGAASAPLTTLSLEVRLVAAQCLAAVGGCQAAMGGLSEIGAAAHGELLEELDALGRALGDYRTEVAAGAARLDSLTTLSSRAAARMAEMGREVGALDRAIARIRGLADALEAVGRDCARGPAEQEQADPAILTALWDLYTMDEERAVHAELFAAPSARPAVAASAAVDLDDVFF
jgi:hypothetical protein